MDLVAITCQPLKLVNCKKRKNDHQINNQLIKLQSRRQFMSTFVGGLAIAPLIAKPLKRAQEKIRLDGAGGDRPGNGFGTRFAI
jgi:hypothetical protein